MEGIGDTPFQQIQDLKLSSFPFSPERDILTAEFAGSPERCKDMDWDLT